MLVAVNVVGGVVPEGGNNDARLMTLTVFAPVLATTAAPIASSMPTPVGLVPVVTSGTFATAGLLVKSRMVAVLVPWLATTARPSFWLIATPCGVVPTETGLPSNWPKVGLAGLRSTFTMLLQPDTLTRPKGEKGPLAI